MKGLDLGDEGVTTIKRCCQVVQLILHASAGSGSVMTVTRSQNEVLRLLQVADRFFSESGGRNHINLTASSRAAGLIGATQSTT